MTAHPAIAAGAAALRVLPRFRYMSQRDAEAVSRAANVAFLRQLVADLPGKIDAIDYLTKVAKSIAEDR